MTIPANLNLEGSPYGAQPVIQVIGPQGGPYTVSGPVGLTILPLAARTVVTGSALILNPGYKGILLTLGVTVNPGGAQTLQLTLFAQDPSFLVQTAFLTVPASATPGGVYLLYPGLSGAAVEGVAITRNLILPTSFTVAVTPSGAGSWTYSVNGILLP